jgi:CRISPR/Cas system-associated protein Cas10 (large subunit of type III CRISPR-Cas system)
MKKRNSLLHKKKTEVKKSKTSLQSTMLMHILLTLSYIVDSVDTNDPFLIELGLVLMR